MGPSGSGKSTLLNALANRPSGKGIETSGLLTFNRAVPDVKTIQKLSTYVEQEDNLIGSLSVRETIDFAARLSFPR